ncbi:MAG: hypothetical protein O2930_12665 [Acidobacteria bacterium]|nr:hypothetical protein [Acidobacteriota bacterium]
MRSDPTTRVEQFDARGDPGGQHVLTVHAQPEAGDRDADLGRCDVAILSGWIVENARHPLGQAAALSRLVLDVGARRADDGNSAATNRPLAATSYCAR